VVVVTVGPKEGEQQVRTALAMGADRAVLVEAGSDLDSLAVAKVLAKVVVAEQADLVLMGSSRWTTDTIRWGRSWRRCSGGRRRRSRRGRVRRGQQEGERDPRGRRRARDDRSGAPGGGDRGTCG